MQIRLTDEEVAQAVELWLNEQRKTHLAKIVIEHAWQDDPDEGYCVAVEFDDP